MRAQDVMTMKPVCCCQDDEVVSAAEKMRDHGIGALPVVNDQGNLIGIVTDRDMVVRGLASGGGVSLRVLDVVTTENLRTAKPEDSIETVIEEMEEGQVRRIVVVDDDGKPVGVISLADIALEVEEPETIAEVLEEISEPAWSSKPTGY